MSLARWADFSAGWPGAAALKAAGFAGVICYVGLGSGTKRLTAAHYQDCAANGLEVLLVAEFDSHDAEHGYATGAANAQLALSDARALGIPDSVGIACAADEHLTAAQIPTAVEYARGFHDVLGVQRTGAYGFQEFVDAVYAAGLASWWWRCGSAPNEPWMTFWQRNDGTQVVNGIQVDIDEQLNLMDGAPDMTPEQIAELFNRLKFLEASTRTISNQLSGNPTGEPIFDGGNNNAPVPVADWGWASLVDGQRRSLVDTVRRIEQIAAQDSALDGQVLDVVKTLSAPTVDVAALATALQNTLAPDIVKALGQKLVA